MSKNMVVKYLNPSEEVFDGEGAKFALMQDGKTLATVEFSFADQDGFDSGGEQMVSRIIMLEDAHLLSPLHAKSIVLSTIMQSWGKNHDCFEAVFENGDLQVNLVTAPIDSNIACSYKVIVEQYDNAGELIGTVTRTAIEDHNEQITFGKEAPYTLADREDVDAMSMIIECDHLLMKLGETF